MIDRQLVYDALAKSLKEQGVLHAVNVSALCDAVEMAERRSQQPKHR